MNKFRKSKIAKILSVLIAISVLNTIISPSQIFALTQGPNSPEFMTFTPVASTNMVNLASGDFNYNIPVIEIPGTDGGGYAMSLSYHSGNKMDQEASWVGFGWNLNPGSINRDARGFPDEFDGENVEYYKKNRPNWSITASEVGGSGIAGQDVGSYKHPLTFDNYGGFTTSFTYGWGLNLKGWSLRYDLTFSPEGITQHPSISVDLMKMSMNRMRKRSDKKLDAAMEENDLDATLAQIDKMFKVEDVISRMEKISVPNAGVQPTGAYGLFTFSDAVRSTAFTKTEGFSYRLGSTMGINVKIFSWNFGRIYDIAMNYPIADRTLKAYGYFNHPGGSDIKNSVMDYYTEKADNYNKRDVFIGMPFNNYDIFNVAGEGLRGGFRGYCDDIRYNIPQGMGDESKSKSAHFQLNGDYGKSGKKKSVGVNIDIGTGSRKTSLKSWKSHTNTFKDFFFRFNNDMGGEISYGHDNTDLDLAEIYYHRNVPGFKKVELNEEGLHKEDYDNSIQDINLVKERATSASYIDYHTKADLSSSDKSFTKSISSDDFSDLVPDESILEFSITNEAGLNYVYGQPLFTRYQTQLTIDIDRDKGNIYKEYLAFKDLPIREDLSNSDDRPWDINKNYYKGTEYNTILGEIQPTPYVKTYLLSQICTPTYVDVNNNGPDEKDFGGWTKFSYRKEYGEGEDNWFKYRTPFNGVHYSQNSLTDPRDDAGGVQMGEKELAYLESVETKTHIAFFVTNEFEFEKAKYNDIEYAVPNGSYIQDQVEANLRQDGYGAAVETMASNPYHSNKNENTRAQKLERIVLFAKNRPDKPIKTVHFEYDYSLVPSIPNNRNVDINYKNKTINTIAENTGKLTLKRLWFTYEGLAPVRVSPYDFEYNYHQPPEQVTGIDQQLTPLDKMFENSEYVNLTTEDQNPIYEPAYLDEWGNVMQYAKERKEMRVPGIYQGKDVNNDKHLNNSWRKDASSNTNGYDPAAWQLKQIKLPSGGEIHIQYEEKDYHHVQDQPVMAMASLRKMENNSDEKTEFQINVDDLGCDPTSEEDVNALCNKIKNYYRENSVEGNITNNSTNKIFYKFLYKLIHNDDRLSVDLDNPRAEYITGYAKLGGAYVVPYQNNGGDECYAIRLEFNAEDSKEGHFAITPREAAYRFLVNKRMGVLEGSHNDKRGSVNYNSVYDGMATEVAYGDRKPLKFSREVMSQFGLENILSYSFYFRDKVCGDMSPALSYVKLPMLTSKKGGGHRVKRLMIYDKGLESGTAVVYGQQYHYVLEDGKTSSGVATNEPQLLRNENPLVKFIPRGGQSALSILTSGEDEQQTEGPIGESLLPPAYITYGRVVVENIHSDKVKNGFTEHRYLTTKDYPFNYYYKSKTNPNNNQELMDVKGNGVRMSELRNFDNSLSINAGLININNNTSWTAQGFRFIINAMNGMQKSITAYAGEYNENPLSGKKDLDNGVLVTRTDYEYYEPGEKVKMVYWDTDSKTFKTDYRIPGKEMEIAMEKKHMQDRSVDVSLEIGLSFVFKNCLSGVGVSFSSNATNLYMHATSKVLYYPTILKSVTNYQEGVKTKQEHLAFNVSTGQPIITSSQDSYSGLGLPLSDELNEAGKVYSFKVPAEWFYPELGQKSKETFESSPAPHTKTNQLTAVAANITTYGSYPHSDWIRPDATVSSSAYKFDIDNVLGISTQTYSTMGYTPEWINDRIKSIYKETTNALPSLGPIWRPKASYIINKTELTEGTNNMYDRGYYSVNSIFDWKDPAKNMDWTKVGEITLYSPHGNPLEEKNALGIPSSVLYNQSYNSELPVMVAQNAGFNEIYFNSFEANEENVSYSNEAHAGVKSLILSNGNIVTDMTATKNLTQKGATLNFWLSSEPLEELKDKIVLTNSSGNQVIANKIAQVNKWYLYNAVIQPTYFDENTVIELNLSNDGNAIAGGTLLIDDVCFKPKDAQASCFVYDNLTYKLLTQFDDQHFGMYYAYNQQGDLTHKMIETERGRYTVQESHHNMPEVELINE